VTEISTGEIIHLKY